MRGVVSAVGCRPLLCAVTTSMISFADEGLSKNLEGAERISSPGKRLHQSVQNASRQIAYLHGARRQLRAPQSRLGIGIEVRSWIRVSRRGTRKVVQRSFGCFPV